MTRWMAGTARWALATCAMIPGAAQADSLRDALVSAYTTNPTLQAARADQRAVDENVSIERAAGLPGISASASYTDYIYQSNSSPLNADSQYGAAVSLGVPVYSGGAVKNGVRAAKTRVKAGQAELRATESGVFSQVVAAYMDVIQNEAIVGLSGNLVDVLAVNLKATTDRFEIGDLTRTDVAQSRSRLELARGDLRSARSNLLAARERYIELVGREPGTLEPPPPLPNLPEDPAVAVSVALENNPDLIAARERSEAAGYDIKVAGSSRMPRIELFAGTDYTHSERSGTAALGAIFPNSSTAATAGVRATIPIYQGGRPAALERQAQAHASATLEREIAAEREVIAQARATYSSWRAANAIIETTQSAIDAAELSLQGVRAENTVGNRTILDILDAEQELLRARVQLVTARRNAYVAGFSLLAAMGRAEARDLALDPGGPLYDPGANYERVRSKLSDWDGDPAPVAKSTRTVDTPTQEGAIPNGQ
jgi:outer membrane protein